MLPSVIISGGLNRKRDDLRLLLDELLGAVRDARLQQEELIVNQLTWTAALISLVDPDGLDPAAEFLNIPAQLAGRLSRGLTDLDRGELVRLLESHVAREVIALQLGVNDRRVRGLRQMALEPTEAKTLMHEHDIPESLYRQLQTVPRTRPLAELLECLGRMKEQMGCFPSCAQTARWDCAVRNHPDRHAYELLLEVVDEK